MRHAHTAYAWDSGLSPGICEIARLRPIAREQLNFHVKQESLRSGGFRCDCCWKFVHTYDWLAESSTCLFANREPSVSRSPRIRFASGLELRWSRPKRRRASHAHRLNVATLRMARSCYYCRRAFGKTKHSMSPANRNAGSSSLEHPRSPGKSSGASRKLAEERPALFTVQFSAGSLQLERGKS